MIVIIIAVTAMFVLAELGINIAPLLASAGVVGLAIGFGAQKLIQDVITGIFIQLEGAIDVGDVVTVGGTSGVVERLTIRSVALRDLQGVYHIVPFSSVDMVSNYMRGFAYVVSEMSVAYRENVDEVKKAIYDAFEKLKELPEIRASILDEELEWMGLDRFGASEVVLRSRIKTLPGKQWETGRAFNAEIKKIFDERDIEIPFPHQTVYFGVDKKGEAPPMHVVNTGPPPKSAKPAPARPASSRRAPAKSTAAKKGAPRKRVRRGGSTPDMPDND
jgi:small conductance mechanosensitive channel